MRLWIAFREGEDIMGDMWGDPRGREGVGIEVPHKEGVGIGGMWVQAWLRISKGSVHVDLR